MDHSHEGRDLYRWGEYARTLGAHLSPQARRLVLFHACWRLAANFEGLSTPGYADRIVQGYSSGFKVFLAYTAHEQLGKALDLEHYELAVDPDQDLAADIRRTFSDLGRLLDREARLGQVGALARFWSGDHDDLRVVGAAIRNEVAHGPFSGSRLRTATSRAVMHRLADAILRSAEARFGSWLDERTV